MMRELLILNAATAGLTVFLLIGCRDSAVTETIRDGLTTPVPATASTSISEPPTASGTPTRTPLPTSTASDTAPIRTAGTILAREPGTVPLGIPIAEHPDNPNSGEQYFVRVAPETRIFEHTIDGIEPRSRQDLRPGQRVAVAFAGGIATSYPGQGTADEIIIFRTHTDGPADPNDLVVMTFQFSVFSFVGDIPPNDAFILRYADGTGNERQIHLCGGADAGSKPCNGSRSTFVTDVEVPRGSELTYTIYRVPGTDPTQLEVVESGREIMDLDLRANSHFRYGAANPGGFD